VSGRLSAAERTRRVNSAILDLRIALANPAVSGERRTLLRDELLALRLARIGVPVRGQRSYLNRLGIAPPRS
jgi:hypothetical protein